eukprot:6632136-Alexandrium_andersonii.AAC.1
MQAVFAGSTLFRTRSSTMAASISPASSGVESSMSPSLSESESRKGAASNECSRRALRSQECEEAIAGVASFSQTGCCRGCAYKLCSCACREPSDASVT